jgi:hypothetical protein
MTDRVKILFLSACPKDISRVRLDQEVRDIDACIQRGEFRDHLELIQHSAVRPADLREALLRHKPHILHFSGHGSATEGIVVEDESGNTKFLSTEALADLFGVIKDNLRVVVLNACFSAVQAEAIRQVVDFTVGMRKEIGDRSAIVFSVAFYQGLAYGRSVKESFRLGVNALKSEGIPESETPALLVKEGADSANTYLVSPRERPVPEDPPSGDRRVKSRASTTVRGDYYDTTINDGVHTKGDFHIGSNRK